jgi:SAM-dependent methyltransferase
MVSRDLAKAASCGEPSYIWRAGQLRRLNMILNAGEEDRLQGRVLENGCGVGMYVQHLAPHCASIIGLEYDFERAAEAHKNSIQIANAASENLPFPDQTFSLIVSHEVLEHVQDDALAVREMVRVLKPGGRITLFVPNRGYPFETHGAYWRGKYHFGNIPFINWLPARWRNKLAPHVRIYTHRDLQRLFRGLPVRIVRHTVIFGAYDNLIVRFGAAGRLLRSVLQWAERTPLKIFGLSHFWVIEKLP